MIQYNDAEASSLVLNSEKIIEKFGNYDIDVLQSDQRIRVSSLYSTHQGKKLTRTFSVVHCPAVVNTLFATEHQEIVNGQSIGAVFKHHGWHIEKRSVFFGEIEASPDFEPVYALMGNISPTPLATHIYIMIVKKQGAKFRYGTLAEVHHPKYLNISDLKTAYQQDRNKKMSLHVYKMVDVVKDMMKNTWVV